MFCQRGRLPRLINFHLEAVIENNIENNIEAKISTEDVNERY